MFFGHVPALSVCCGHWGTLLGSSQYEQPERCWSHWDWGECALTPGVCASSLCTCQMQGQKGCFSRAKTLWKCWHSCWRMKYFLPQHCGKDGSCPPPLQTARYVNDPTAERFSSDICRQGMLPWAAGGEAVQPHFRDVSGTAQCWPAELESPKIHPLLNGCVTSSSGAGRSFEGLGRKVVI